MEIPEADPIDRNGEQRIKHPNCMRQAKRDFAPVTDHGVYRQQHVRQCQSVDEREEQHDKIKCVHGVPPKLLYSDPASYVADYSPAGNRTLYCAQQMGPSASRSRVRVRQVEEVDPQLPVRSRSPLRQSDETCPARPFLPRISARGLSAGNPAAESHDVVAVRLLSRRHPGRECQSGAHRLATTNQSRTNRNGCLRDERTETRRTTFTCETHQKTPNRNERSRIRFPLPALAFEHENRTSAYLPVTNWSRSSKRAERRLSVTKRPAVSSVCRS